MKHKRILKFQRGYLLIISIGIALVISIVAVLLINMFGGSIKSTENISESNSAFFVATSGLQLAKRDIIELDKRCTDINGNTLYTNASFCVVALYWSSVDIFLSWFFRALMIRSRISKAALRVKVIAMISSGLFTWESSFR